MNLARKAVYGLRSRTLDQRLRSTGEEFLALTDEVSKVTADPNFMKAMSSSLEEAKHVDVVTRDFGKSLEKLAERWEHFQEHERPKYMACDMFRDLVSPSVAAALTASLIGAIAYRRHLKKKYQALDKELLAEIKQVQG